MMKKILYHGSSHIIQKPIYGHGKSYNDYGLGFYCTEHLELAKEWACTLNTDGYVNKYEIDLSDLSILNLSDEKYSILHWLTLLIEHRQFRIDSPIMKLGCEWLKNNYHIDLSPYDIIIGYRADDSYFAFARAFLTNQISLSQLSYAMHLGKLGHQVVIKSLKAFNRIQFKSSEYVDSSLYYPKRKTRDEKARQDFKKELENIDLNSAHIRDLIRKEVKQ